MAGLPSCQVEEILHGKVADVNRGYVLSRQMGLPTRTGTINSRDSATLTTMLPIMRRPSTSLFKNSTRTLKKWWLLIIVCVCIAAWFLGQHLHESEPTFARRVRQLYHEARVLQRTRLATQSSSLGEARNEYEQRYGFEPPPGYDDWYRYATSQSSPLIDDFDGLMEDLRPYRSFHSSHCDSAAGKVYSTDIVRICITSNQVFVDGAQEHIQPLLTILNDLLAHLPDLCFVVNTMATPRTVLNHATVAALFGPVPPTTCEIQRFWDASRRNVWGEITQSCTHDSSARTDLLKRDQSGTLQTDWMAVTELCSRTSPPTSGVILSAEHFRLSRVVRPVLSSAVLATFQDIRYPSAAHVHAALKAPDDWNSWDDKQAMLSWRGDTAGGWATESNWHDLQRQRLVVLGHTRPTAHDAGPLSSQTVDEHGALLGNARPRNRNNLQRPKTRTSLIDFLDVKFTNYTSCDEGACAMMRKEFNDNAEVRPTESEMFASKLILSMDGASADTAGFYAALKSNSAIPGKYLVAQRRYWI